MASANRVGLSSVEEAVYDTLPTGDIALKERRFTSENLRQQNETTTSDELRFDRQTDDEVLTGISATGDVNWEFSYGAHDDWFESAFLADGGWNAGQNVAASTVIGFTTGPDTIDASGQDEIFASFIVGQAIEIRKLESPNHELKGTITAIGDSNPGVSDNDILTVDFTLTPEAAGAGNAVSILGGTHTLAVADATFAAVDNSITSATTLAFASLSVGSGIAISGSTIAGNNTMAIVTAVLDDGVGTSNKITLNYIAIADVGPEAISVKVGESITNGVQERNHHLQNEFGDEPDTFALLSGMAVNSMSLEVSRANAKINGSFGWIGSKEVTNTATIGTVPNIPAATNDIMSAIQNVVAVFENGTSFCAQDFSFNLVNNLETEGKIGLLGATGYFAGSVNITGNIRAIFGGNEKALYDRYLANQSSNVALHFLDNGGNQYFLHLGKIRFSDGSRPAAGKDQNVIMDLSYSALREPSENKTVRLTRIPA